MALAFEQLDRGAGGTVDSIYDRILRVERGSSPDGCLRLLLATDADLVTVYRWVNALWAALRDLRRDGDLLASPCGDLPLVSYRLNLVEGLIGIEITWQANPERPSWPPIAVQLDNLHLPWSYWELWGVKATPPSESPEAVLTRWLRVGVLVAGAFVLGPPLLNAVTAYLQTRRPREQR